jgi:hypothetical protein
MKHTYVAHQTVVLRKGMHSVVSPDRRYLILRLLPHTDGDEPQYLLANLKDGHRRVAGEAQIESGVEREAQSSPEAQSVSSRSKTMARNRATV